MITIKFIPKYFPIILLPLYWVWFLLYYIFGFLIYLIMLIFSPFKTKENIIDFYKKKFSALDRNLTLDKEVVEEDEEETKEVKDDPDIIYLKKYLEYVLCRNKKSLAIVNNLQHSIAQALIIFSHKTNNLK